MKLLLIQYVYSKKEDHQTKKFLLKKINKLTNYIQKTIKFLFEKK
jgi:predicted transcriptional regulator